MAEPQKCTKCDGTHFTEEALQNTYQSGVRIVDGNPNYDDADTIDLGNVEKVNLYTCDGCREEYTIEGGVLVPATAGKTE